MCWENGQKYKQVLSNFQPHFPKFPYQLQAEVEYEVAYKKICVTRKQPWHEGRKNWNKGQEPAYATARDKNIKQGLIFLSLLVLCQVPDLSIKINGIMHTHCVKNTLSGSCPVLAFWGITRQTQHLSSRLKFLSSIPTGWENLGISFLSCRRRKTTFLVISAY